MRWTPAPTVHWKNETCVFISIFGNRTLLGNSYFIRCRKSQNIVGPITETQFSDCLCTKIEGYAAAPKNGYIWLVLIWCWYISKFQIILCAISLLIGMIGNLEVSGPDLAMYSCLSEVTSNIWEDTFVRGSSRTPHRNCFEKWSLKMHFLHFEGFLEPKIKISSFWTSFSVQNKLDFHFANFLGNRPGSCLVINFT